ncbi:hypothetical protein ACQR1I_35485 [Bradyrhizobium sp. HKCCYLS2038]|uniref:hypothetical protein n=1 Tax=unclassified Bradyrhizobium TaxID=2631580 RepID=UPI003EC09941
MRLDLDDKQRARLEQHGDNVMLQLLLGDGWQPLSDYRYDRRYVYVAAVNGVFNYSCYVARGGRYSSSDWWIPSEKEIPVLGAAGLTITHWQPLPDGVDAYRPLAFWKEITGHDLPGAPLRKPEPVYQPAPPTHRLTPGPRRLLAAIGRRRGAA